MNAELTAAFVTLIIALAGLIKSFTSSISIDNVVKDREKTKSKRDNDFGIICHRVNELEKFQEKNEAKQNEINNQLFSKLNEVNNNVIKILTIFDEREREKRNE